LYPANLEVFVAARRKKRYLLSRRTARAPENWEEMLKFARAIKASKPDSRPIFLSGGSAASWNRMSFLWSAGGEAVVETQPGQWRAAFDSPAAVSAYQFYYQLVEADRLAEPTAKLNSKKLVCSSDT